MEIWRGAVDATHHFLNPADRKAIEEELSIFFFQLQLVVAVDFSGRPLGFMYLHREHMQALFVDPDHHGKGIGGALIDSAIAQYRQI